MSDCGVYVPMWQWAEDNQGVLSVAALVAALGIAVLEVIRADNAERQRKREYVDLVSGILAILVDKLNEVAASNPDGAGGDTWTIWDRTDSAINVVRPSAPPDPVLALTLAEAAEFFRTSRPAITAQANNYLERARRVQALRERVLARRRVRSR